MTDMLLQLQNLIEQNHLHGRTRTRKIITIAGQEKNKNVLDWFFLQFATPPYPDFTKTFLNEDLIRAMVETHWDYAWTKITQLLCSNQNGLPLLHYLFDVSSSNPQALQHIISVAIDNIPTCENPAQKTIALSVAHSAVKNNLPNAFNDVVSVSPDVLYSKSYYLEMMVDWASESGSLWLMDVFVAHKISEDIVSQMFTKCAPLYSIQRLEEMYNCAQKCPTTRVINSEFLYALSERFVDLPTASLIEKVVNQGPDFEDRVYSGKMFWRWCSKAIESSIPHHQCEKIIDPMTYKTDLIVPLQTILNNLQRMEECTSLLQYWSVNHSERFSNAIAEVIRTKAVTAQVAKKLIGAFGDVVDHAVVDNWQFNNCEEVARVKLKWNLEQATAEFSGAPARKKM